MPTEDPKNKNNLTLLEWMDQAKIDGLDNSTWGNKSLEKFVKPGMMG